MPIGEAAWTDGQPRAFPSKWPIVWVAAETTVVDPLVLVAVSRALRLWP
jgi:hypothetical protein